MLLKLGNLVFALKIFSHVHLLHVAARKALDLFHVMRLDVAPRCAKTAALARATAVLPACRARCAALVPRARSSLVVLSPERCPPNHTHRDCPSVKRDGLIVRAPVNRSASRPSQQHRLPRAG
ncbi:hypothetical protein HAX54_022156, partial [Datura stramonium]|nr:hypothetical protein [Datura stramonium]